MIKVKNLMEPVEPDDGDRLWVEPSGLTSDLREWCEVDQLLRHLAPSEQTKQFYVDHPEEYDAFRGQYHEELASGEFMPQLREMARSTLYDPVTLLHDDENPNENSAAALHEFLSELQAYCSADADEM